MLHLQCPFQCVVERCGISAPFADVRDSSAVGPGNYVSLTQTSATPQLLAAPVRD